MRSGEGGWQVRNKANFSSEKAWESFEAYNKYGNPNERFQLSLQLCQIGVSPSELLFFMDIDTRLSFCTDVREYHEETDEFALLTFVLVIYNV